MSKIANYEGTRKGVFSHVKNKKALENYFKLPTILNNEKQNESNSIVIVLLSLWYITHSLKILF